MATPPSESIMCANVKTPVLDSLEPCLSNVRTNDDSGYFTPSPAVKSSSHTSIYTTTKQTFTCTPVKKTSLAIKDIPEKYGNNLGPPRIKESIVDSIPVRCANVNKTKQGLRSVQNFDRLKSKLQNVKTSPNLGSPSTTTTMSHDIGSWTKARHVDFIKEFSKLNLKIIISKIFNNLSDIDLSAVCCVSKTWQTICFSDTVSNLRRKNYIKRLRSNVQNLPQETTVAAIVNNVGRIHSVLNAVENVLTERRTDHEKNETQTLSSSELRMYAFYEEGKKLKPNERLDKCPRCSSPARVNIPQNTAKCSYAHCGFAYCILCHCELNASHHCSPVTIHLRKNSTSNKMLSKRNLKRLLE